MTTNIWNPHIISTKETSNMADKDTAERTNCPLSSANLSNSSTLTKIPTTATTTTTTTDSSNNHDKRKDKLERREKRRNRREEKRLLKAKKHDDKERRRALRRAEKDQRRAKRRQRKDGEKDGKQMNKGENQCGPPISLMNTKCRAPETKEEWEARQSIIRRVQDPETGRIRLIKGDGEILEEIVSRDRHMEINKMATQSDGQYFQNRSVGPFGSTYLNENTMY